MFLDKNFGYFMAINYIYVFKLKVIPLPHWSKSNLGCVSESITWYLSGTFYQIKHWFLCKPLNLIKFLRISSSTDICILKVFASNYVEFYFSIIYISEVRIIERVMQAPRCSENGIPIFLLLNIFFFNLFRMNIYQQLTR